MSSSSSSHNAMPLCPLKKGSNMCGGSLGKTNTNGETLKKTNPLMDVLGNKYLFAEIYKCHETWKYRDAHKRRMKPVLSLIKNMSVLFNQIKKYDKQTITDENGKMIISFSELRKIIKSTGDLPPSWEYNSKVTYAIKTHVLKLTTKKYTVASTMTTSDLQNNVFWVDYIKFYGWYNFYNIEKWRIFLKEWELKYDIYLRRHVFY